MNSVRKSLAISLIERYLLILLSLASNVILARLLTPEEIGIYSVTLAFIGVAHVLRDFGIGNYLIQEKELDERHIRTAFGISIIIGMIIFVILLLAAPHVSTFYREPRMTTIMQVIALNFLVLPFCTISLALLRREMQFQRLLYVTLSAAAVGFIVTIGFALQGIGPLSMAIGAVAINVVTGFGSWLASPQQRILMPGFSEWRRIIGFGGRSAGTNLVTTIAMDINELVVGRLLGFSAVAILSKAQGLMYLFHRDLMTAVRNVAYPAFAKAHRNGEELDGKHTYSITAVTAFAWPFYGFVALFHLEATRIMFGPQWDEAARLVPIFCLAGAFSAVGSLALSTMLAIGRIDLVTRTELIIQPLRAIVIVGAVLVFQTILASALAFLFIFAASVPFTYYMKQKCIKTDYALLYRGLSSSAALALLTLAPALILAIAFPAGDTFGHMIMKLACAALPSAIAWLAGLYLFKHPIRNEAAIIKIVRRLGYGH